MGILQDHFREKELKKILEKSQLSEQEIEAKRREFGINWDLEKEIKDFIDK